MAREPLLLWKILTPRSASKDDDARQTRVTLAQIRIMASRQTGGRISDEVDRISDEVIVKKVGFKDLNDYWAAQLSKPKMKATDSPI